MFIGHFGVGLAAKKAAPQVSLGILFIACQWLDLLWPTLLLLDLEHVAIKPGTGHAQPLDFIYYPISHSLLMVVLWAALFGLIYWLAKRNTKGAVVVGLLVLSHWLIDLMVHFPDLPLYPGNSPLFGFGLWEYKIPTLIIESIIFITGVLLYHKTTHAINRSGTTGLWAIIILLAAVHLANIFGPPPPNVAAIAWAGQLQWLFVLLAYWTDRHRATK